MNMETFSAKQVIVLVFGIVAAIAFLETSFPLSTADFWREFLLKLVIYGAASEFVVVVLGNTRMFEKKDRE